MTTPRVTETHRHGHGHDTIPCFGCATPIQAMPGNYYCGPCVAQQMAAQDAERVAFDAYHAYADRVARNA